MRILQVGLLSLWLMLVSCLPALSQDGQSRGTLSAPAPASFNEVMDRVIQKEHFFLAQMRHMRPMVETYLQDLKTDSNGNAIPVKDQYFLGRLDMSDGPEDTSFVGQAGFGRRMLNRLTGLYAMQFLPLGFAQMVVLDTDFQKKYYDFTFVRREFLGEVRCLVIDVQRNLLPSPEERLLPALRQLAPEHALRGVVARLHLQRRVGHEDVYRPAFALPGANPSLGI